MLYFLYDHTVELSELGNPGDWLVNTLGVATLYDYKFTFRTLPNIEECNGEHVTGVLIYFDIDMISRLNEMEGCPTVYTKIQRPVKYLQKSLSAKIYTQKFTKLTPYQQPHPNYLSNLYKLYMENGLPLDQINNALKELNNCH